MEAGLLNTVLSPWFVMTFFQLWRYWDIKENFFILYKGEIFWSFMDECEGAKSTDRVQYVPLELPDLCQALTHHLFCYMLFEFLLVNHWVFTMLACAVANVIHTMPPVHPAAVCVYWKDTLNYCSTATFGFIVLAAMATAWFLLKPPSQVHCHLL